MNPELNTLVEGCDTKVPDSLLHRRACYLNGTVAICVRFDNKENVTLGSDVRFDVLKILVESIEVDLEPG